MPPATHDFPRATSPRATYHFALAPRRVGLCWAINLSPFGLFVSFLIVSLVPAREHVLPGLFSAAELAVLDPTEPPAAGEPPALLACRAQLARSDHRDGC